MIGYDVLVYRLTPETRWWRRRVLRRTHRRVTVFAGAATSLSYDRTLNGGARVEVRIEAEDAIAFLSRVRVPA